MTREEFKKIKVGDFVIHNNNKKEVIGKTSQWLKLRDNNGENSYVMYETLFELHHCNNNNLKDSVAIVNVYNKNDDLVGSVKIDGGLYSNQLKEFMKFPNVECCKEENKEVLSKFFEDAKVKLPDNLLEKFPLFSKKCFRNKNEMEQKIIDFEKAVDEYIDSKKFENYNSKITKAFEIKWITEKHSGVITVLANNLSRAKRKLRRHLERVFQETIISVDCTNRIDLLK
jgi:hypothetical protein|nr:MAG TPA: hypothetical protein [Caudoviricetes sp.]